MISSADVEQALDILEGMSQDEIDRLRGMIAEIEARVRAKAPVAHAGPSIRSSATGWSPIAAALFFVIWSSSDASLARSL